MLSTAAFNGLLKTLEEPPDNVVFVFATTEIRRVPVTVLSRCQRFDLRRVDSDALAGHFAMVSAKEEVEIEPAAIDIIARAADGSVRDGLSLLDQAMALSGGAITATQIRDMLGLADRVAIFDLFDSVMSGDIASALDRFQIMYRDGADPAPLIDPEAAVAADTAGKLRRYEDVVALFDENREGIMTAHLRHDVHLVGFSQHRIEFRPGPNAPRDLANRMGRLLSDWTGERWIVSVSDAPGAPTLAEQRAAMDSERLAEAERDPLVQAVKETFPGAKIRGIIDRSKDASPDTQENDET